MTITINTEVSDGGPYEAGPTLELQAVPRVGDFVELVNDEHGIVKAVFWLRDGSVLLKIRS
jgi:hypothetical protein